MQSQIGQSSWDLTPVFDLIHSLKTYRDDSTSRAGDHGQYNGEETDELIKSSPGTSYSSSGLGNLDRVLNFLNVQRDRPLASSPHFEISSNATGQKDAAYTSDGALYYPASSRSVRWRDDEDGQDLTDVLPDSPDERQLTKTQRKKRNRKIRKAEAAGKIPTVNKNTSTSALGTTAEDSENSPPLTPKTLACQITPSHAFEKNSGVHHGVYSHVESTTEEHQPTHSHKTSVSSIESKVVDKSRDRLHTTVPMHAKRQKANTTPVDVAREKVAAALLNRSKRETAISPCPSRAAQENLLERWPIAHPQIITSSRDGTKSTTNPTSYDKSQHVSNGPTQVKSTAPTFAVTPRGRHEILPFHNKSLIDRNWALFIKVLHNFPEDRGYLVSPLQLSINRPQKSGIHVFVDTSNIMIGFMEHLKRSRSIPAHVKVPRVDLNFHALALLLERRRPVARRVLAGSTPEVPAFEEARQVGYETNILDKVFKKRELTERQKYFELRDRAYISGNEGFGDDDGSLSESGQQRQPKWVEQAVDEILHLKILESVIDYEVPVSTVDGSDANASGQPSRPTMVVATGDAAEAEYSPGFLKMVERALKKGWNVEITAFGRSVSAGYRKMEKLPMNRGGWGERFRIIELDDYAEELFGESM